jgi:hypothetical protein
VHEVSDLLVSRLGREGRGERSPPRGLELEERGHEEIEGVGARVAEVGEGHAGGGERGLGVTQEARHVDASGGEARERARRGHRLPGAALVGDAPEGRGVTGPAGEGGELDARGADVRRRIAEGVAEQSRLRRSGASAGEHADHGLPNQGILAPLEGADAIEEGRPVRGEGGRDLDPHRGVRIPEAAEQEAARLRGAASGETEDRAASNASAPRLEALTQEPEGALTLTIASQKGPRRAIEARSLLGGSAALEGSRERPQSRAAGLDERDLRAFRRRRASGDGVGQGQAAGGARGGGESDEEDERGHRRVPFGRDRLDLRHELR